MKKLTLAVAALALALPTAAFAHKPPHPGKTTKGNSATAHAAIHNSAFMCKAMRRDNPAGFATAFGTDKNAYGKCVSSHARAKHHNVTITLTNLTLSSAGTMTSAGAPGCQFTAAGCTVTSAGTVGGPLVGTYSATYTILWSSPSTTSNGAGGFCAPATGTVTLTFGGLGSITKSESGTVCEVGATGTNVEHTMTNGTFNVSGGTGLFSGSTGSGTASFDQKPDGSVTGSETFSTLTLKV